MSFRVPFENLINSEFGKTCLLLGPGPSMIDFPFSKFNGKIICFGDSIIRGKGLFKADYWIASNNEFPVPDYSKHLDIINSFTETKFIFSDTALYDNLWTKSDEYLEKYLKVYWSIFSERHFLNKPCNPKNKCCELINKDVPRLSIQEIFKKSFHLSKFDLEIGNTVAEYALYLALILGFKKIFIQGVDLPRYSKDYKYYKNDEADKLLAHTMDFIKKELRKNLFNEVKSFKIYKKIIFFKLQKIISKLSFDNKSIFNKDLNVILDKFDLLAEISKSFDIEIFNLNENSSLNKCKNINHISTKNLIFN